MIKLAVRTTPEDSAKAEALIIPLSEALPPARYRSIDALIGGLIGRVIKSGEFGGKEGQTSLLHVDGITAPRILLVGLGDAAKPTAEGLRRAGAKAFAALRDLGLRHVALAARLFDPFPESTLAAQAPSFYFLEGGLLGLYRFAKYKRNAVNGNGRKRIESCTVLSDERSFPTAWLETLTGAAVFARDLVNTPANDMTPSTMAALAKSLADDRISVLVLGSAEAKKKGLGAFVAVAKGSAEEPRFVVLEYRGGKGAPIVLVGKSVTFDSGGYNLKPSDGIERMKYDMAGGAAVLAVFRALKTMKLRLNVVGILPCTENLIGGKATKPGDVVTSIGGKTIEIVNTDAEGRLTLADAIGYAVKFHSPRAIIDIATLTGACSMAFGAEAIAMMGTDQPLMDRLKAASDEVYERVWPMPLFAEYGDYLKGDIADIKNIGGRKGALSSSAFFLKEFTGEVPWVHLDIAGISWNEKDKPYIPRGASGCGARLLLTFLKGHEQ